MSINGGERVNVSAAGVIKFNAYSTGLLHSDSSGVLTSALVANSDLATASALSTASTVMLRDSSGNSALQNATLDGTGSSTTVPALFFSKGSSTNTGLSANANVISVITKLHAQNSLHELLLFIKETQPTWYRGAISAAIETNLLHALNRHVVGKAIKGFIFKVAREQDDRWQPLANRMYHSSDCCAHQLYVHSMQILDLIDFQPLKSAVPKTADEAFNTFLIKCWAPAFAQHVANAQSWTIHLVCDLTMKFVTLADGRQVAMSNTGDLLMTQ